MSKSKVFANKFKAQLEIERKSEPIPFNKLNKGHVYAVVKTDMEENKYGEKYTLYVRDLENDKEIIKVWAPSSYIRKCEYRKIDIYDKHFFMYEGQEEKVKNKQKYTQYNFEIVKELEGVELSEVNDESDGENDE